MTPQGWHSVTGCLAEHTSTACTQRHAQLLLLAHTRRHDRHTHSLLQNSTSLARLALRLATSTQSGVHWLLPGVPCWWEGGAGRQVVGEGVGGRRVGLVVWVGMLRTPGGARSDNQRAGIAAKRPKQTNRTRPPGRQFKKLTISRASSAVQFCAEAQHSSARSSRPAEKSFAETAMVLLTA